MILNLPPNGVAGLALMAVRSSRREPRPPAMIMAIVLRVSRLTNRPDLPVALNSSTSAVIDWYIDSTQGCITKQRKIAQYLDQIKSAVMKQFTLSTDQNTLWPSRRRSHGDPFSVLGGTARAGGRVSLFLPRTQNVWLESEDQPMERLGTDMFE